MFCKSLKKITAITSTICHLMNVEKPANSTRVVLKEVIEKANALGINKIDKCLVFAPDAIGSFLIEKYLKNFSFLRDSNTLSIELCSVFPPKTPVCFASMFSGALPEKHGIKAYQKPTLHCDTIFDSMIRSKKKVAIVAVKDSSIDLIFRERNIDYFSEKNDNEVLSRTMSIIKEKKKYDLTIVYNQEYDDILHKTSPESEEAIQAMKNHLKNYKTIIDLIANYWAESNNLIAFTPDHGAHFDEKSKTGIHGDNIPVDMLVTHFFTFIKKR